MTKLQLTTWAKSVKQTISVIGDDLDKFLSKEEIEKDYTAVTAYYDEISNLSASLINAKQHLYEIILVDKTY